MNQREELNAFIKECLTEALINLMAGENFADITVTELIKAAGVSRVSFYRNFDSKEDILTQYLRSLFLRWADDFRRHGSPTRFAESLLCHFYDNKAFYLLLYRQRVSGLVFDAIRWAVRMDEAGDGGERYVRSAFAGLVFGSVMEWLEHGMRETPEEVLRLTPLESDELFRFSPAARRSALPDEL